MLETGKQVLLTLQHRVWANYNTRMSGNKLAACEEKTGGYTEADEDGELQVLDVRSYSHQEVTPSLCKTHKKGTEHKQHYKIQKYADKLHEHHTNKNS